MATCAIRGSRPVPSYMRSSHCRQMDPSGVATQSLIGQVARGDDGAAGQPVIAADDHLGEVAGQCGAGEVIGHRQRQVAPAVRDAEVSLPGRDQADRVPGFVLRQGDAQVRVRRQDGGQRGRDQAAHRGGERGQPHVPGDGLGLLVQPGLQLLQVGEQPVPCSTRCLPCLVSITPRPTRSSSGTPVCFSRRLTCCDTALGVKPSASAAAITEPWAPTARSESSATRSIMKQCYMIYCMNIRWCFMVVPGHTGLA